MSEKEHQQRLAANIEPFLKGLKNLQARHKLSDFKVNLQFMHDSDPQLQACQIPPCKWVQVFNPTTGKVENECQCPPPPGE